MAAQNRLKFCFICRKTGHLNFQCCDRLTENAESNQQLFLRLNPEEEQRQAEIKKEKEEEKEKARKDAPTTPVITNSCYNF